MKPVYAAVVGLVVLAGLVPSAQAGSKDPCEVDARRFCRDAIPDDAKIAACLKANQGKLSGACKASYATRAKAKGM